MSETQPKTAGDQRRQRQRSSASGLNNFLYRAVLALVVLTPLPLASARPVWQSLIALIIGVLFLLYVYERYSAGGPVFPNFRHFIIPSVAFGLALLWAFLQAVPGLFPSLHHPLWAEARDALNLTAEEMPGALSLSPEDTLFSSMVFLSYALLFFLTYGLFRRRRRITRLLWIFVLASAAYALYGLAAYWSGSEMILWMQKWAYKGFLTSTFVNRNSYATYAGMGLLTSFALTISLIRPVLEDGISRGEMIRRSINIFAHWGWLPFTTIFLLLSVILLTGSRAGLGATIAGAFALSLSWALVQRSTAARRTGYWIAGILGFLLLLGLFLSGDSTLERFGSVDDSFEVRRTAYAIAWQGILERPWLGYGLGTFEHSFMLFGDGSLRAYFDRAHNDYIELAFTLGIPAATAVLASFVALFAWACFGLKRLFEDAALAALAIGLTLLIGLHALVDFSMQMPAVSIAYFVLQAAALRQFGFPAQTS